MSGDAVSGDHGMKDQIAAFHQSGCCGVLAITGGGSGLISELLSVPGGSASVLEAMVPYGDASLRELLKQRPDQACAPATALAMAAAAYRRAIDLNEVDGASLFGLGLTASLVSSRPKRGEHRVHAAVQSATQTRVVSLVLSKGVRSRVEEEAVASRCGISMLLHLADLLGHDVLADVLVENEEPRHDEADADERWAPVRSGEAAYACWPDGVERAAPSGLLSGSFNPKHHGHERLREVAAEFLGVEVGYELAIVNAAKPPLDDVTLRDRLKQFEDGVVLSAAPTFAEKAAIFPRSTFVIGVDTAVRILDGRYYAGGSANDALAAIEHQRCRFLVAARHDAGEVITINDLAVPDRFADLFQELPADRFLEDVSSTALRSRGDQ